MDEPRYHLGSVVHAKGETLEDIIVAVERRELDDSAII